MQPATDPYRALGVQRGASEADIKAAHRRLAKRFHPDSSGGDTVRFLAVQEAYRVLSDPLLRREWDARHAGPVRATEPAAARPRTSRAARRSGGSSRTTPRPPAARPEGDSAPPAGPGRPRSARAYTWSASEVPWWEEGTSREKRRATPHPTDAAPPAGAARPEAAPDFDVYNRSRGAAWSMAARAYFRKGDQELPSRGSFHHQGTQPLTAARARAAAEAEARQGAARVYRQKPQASPQHQAPKTAAADRPKPPPSPGAAARPAAQARTAPPTFVYASVGVARDAQSVSRAREQFLRRIRAQHWPSLKERLLYALLAWLPIAALIAYGGWVGTGCDRALASCPPSIEIVQGSLMAFSLALFALLPRLAYVLASGTIGLLIVAALAVGALILFAAPLPLSLEMVAGVGALLAVGYVLAAVAAIARGGPWRVPWT